VRGGGGRDGAHTTIGYFGRVANVFAFKQDTYNGEQNLCGWVMMLDVGHESERVKKGESRERKGPGKKPFVVWKLIYNKGFTHRY